METVSALLDLCEGNYRLPANSPHKGQWRETLMFSWIWARTNGWANDRDAGDLRHAHYDVIVMDNQVFWHNMEFLDFNKVQMYKDTLLPSMCILHIC